MSMKSILKSIISTANSIGIKLHTFEEVAKHNHTKDFYPVIYGKGKIKCTLFGDYVDQLNAFMSTSVLELPVVVLQLANGKLFKNVLHASRLLFNPEISEAVEFRNGLALHGVLGDQPIGIVGDG